MFIYMWHLKNGQWLFTLFFKLFFLSGALLINNVLTVKFVIGLVYHTLNHIRDGTIKR